MPCTGCQTLHFAAALPPVMDGVMPYYVAKNAEGKQTQLFSEDKR